MCHEGGCGACIVAVRSKNAFTKKESTYAVNSVSLFTLCCTPYLNLMTKHLRGEKY